MTSAADDQSRDGQQTTPEQLELAFPRHEQRQVNDLLNAFARAEIDPDQVVARLMVLYQTGMGGAARALAELDQNAAQKLGERLSATVHAFLQELSAKSAIAEPSATRPVNRPVKERLKGKNVTVLRREQAFFKALTQTDQEIPSARLVASARSLEPEISDPTVTAHLDRLIRDGLVARERKGLYRSTARSNDYLRAIAHEIEARDASLSR